MFKDVKFSDKLHLKNIFNFLTFLEASVYIRTFNFDCRNMNRDDVVAIILFCLW